MCRPTSLVLTLLAVLSSFHFPYSFTIRDHSTSVMSVINSCTADPANCSPRPLTGAEPEYELTTVTQTIDSAATTKPCQTQVEPHCRHNECLFRPSEDADRLGKRVQQTVERAARLLRSMNSGEASVRCLKDIVICVTRIRSRLFPYYGDGSAHTRYIRDRSVNILFNTLDRHIRRMQLHAVIRAQESVKAVRVAFILRDAALIENLQVFTEWEDFGR